ncbi:MAG: sugar phosphate isomerase/epimerase family protein [Pirellulaceae bacterium]
MRPDSLNRRQMLRMTSATAMAAALASPTMSAEPISGRTQPKFKYSLAAYSYRGLLTAKDSEFTLSNFINDCAEFQLEGTELTSYYFPKNPSDEYLIGLKGEAFRRGLTISGTAIRNDFCFPAGEKRAWELAQVKDWIDKAVVLSAPVIRIFAGHQKQGVSAEESHQLMVEGLQEVCEYAAQRGVFLALENHGGPTSTAEGLLEIVRDVQSDWLGINLDTGNFHSDRTYEEIAECAPYALNIQVKVVVSGPDKVKHPADYARLAEIFRAANYRGFVVLEFEEKGDPRVECPKHLEEMRKIMGT